MVSSKQVILILVTDDFFIPSERTTLDFDNSYKRTTLLWFRPSNRFCFFYRITLLSVILMNGLHCSGFIQVSDFDSCNG